MKMKKSLLVAAMALVGGQALAIEQGDWLLHLRAINISPNDDSSLIHVGGNGVAKTGVAVDDAYSLDISLAYMLTDNWAIELLADLSSEHTVSANGLEEAANVASGTDVIETNVLPPTVFLQYQFAPKGKIRPYVGVGLNYTMYFSDDFTPAAKTALGASNLDIDSSFGWAAQVGIDWELGNDWFFSVDAKYINIETTATFNTALGGASVDVDINPTVIGVGFGKSF